MKITIIHIIGAIIGLILLGVSFLFLDNLDLFVFILGLAIGLAVLPFVLAVVAENRRTQEINEMFLEFSRNLSESVKAGTPVSKSIMNLKARNYGSLSPYVEKLANQISLGIPVNKSLETFAIEVNNPVISRAITLIREAEKAGGEIESILESSARSIAEIEKLRQERKSAVSTLIAQGYIIFFIFIAIMLVMEFKIVPLTSSLGELNIDINSFDPNQLSNYNPSSNAQDASSAQEAQKKIYFSPFLGLLIIQGLFAGLIIGKISEGDVKSGIKHSFILMMSSFLISTGTRLMFG
jgi:archaeal flagellar protein FlaJ